MWDWLAPMRADHPGTRWMRPDVLHLTLLFTGQVDSGRVPAINDGLAALATRHSVFATRTSGAGGHVDDRPGARRGGVAWLTLGAGAREMTDLALDVDETLGTRTFTARRPPRPHLTVARNIDAPALVALTARAQDLELEWRTSTVVLFRSLLGPGGSRYEPLSTHALAPGS